MFPLIPPSTVRAARALYGQGNPYLRLGDHLNQLASNFDSGIILCLKEEKAALLALLTIIQYVEKLTDAELTEAIGQRMELRYALHLPTPSPRIDPHSLCMFRSRVLMDAKYHSLFEEMFKKIYPEISFTAMDVEPEIDKALSYICEHEIDASLMEAMLCAMEALSANHFTWLRGIALPHWYQRYNRSLLTSHSNYSSRDQEFSREEIQRDIQHLLNEIRKSNSVDILEMHEIQVLHLIWEQFTNRKSMTDCNSCIHKIH